MNLLQGLAIERIKELADESHNVISVNHGNMWAVAIRGTPLNDVTRRLGEISRWATALKEPTK